MTREKLAQWIGEAIKEKAARAAHAFATETPGAAAPAGVVFCSATQWGVHIEAPNARGTGREFLSLDIRRPR